jgi:hypothetical protein
LAQKVAGTTLSVPPGLKPEADLTLNGTLNDGRKLLPMLYSILVGDPVPPAPPTPPAPHT